MGEIINRPSSIQGEKVRTTFSIPTHLHEDSAINATKYGLTLQDYALQSFRLLGFTTLRGFSTQKTHLVVPQKDREVPVPRLSRPPESHTIPLTLTMPLKEHEEFKDLALSADMQPSERARRALRLMNFVFLQDALPNPTFHHEGETFVAVL